MTMDQGEKLLNACIATLQAQERVKTYLFNANYRNRYKVLKYQQDTLVRKLAAIDNTKLKL